MSICNASVIFYLYKPSLVFFWYLYGTYSYFACMFFVANTFRLNQVFPNTPYKGFSPPKFLDNKDITHICLAANSVIIYTFFMLWVPAPFPETPQFPLLWKHWSIMATLWPWPCDPFPNDLPGVFKKHFFFCQKLQLTKDLLLAGALLYQCHHRQQRSEEGLRH